jgi:hypothetical protein
MKGISLVLVLLLLFGVPLLCGAQPEEEEPVQARTLNKVHSQGEASAVQGTAAEAGSVSATPIHLPNPQTQGVQEGVKAGQVSTGVPAQPSNELNTGATAR